jgi:DNA-directed RNA polymerase specialized sigma24 family protein
LRTSIFGAGNWREFCEFDGTFRIEDTAAEVFLKLHAVLEKKNQKYPFRSWACQVQVGIALTNCARASAKNAGNDLCALQDVFTPSPLSQVLHNEANAK